MDYRTATRDERAADFIAVATAVHNGRYDYRHVADQYVNGATAVSIICPDHGVFRQTPSEHRRTVSKNHQAQGCPDCRSRSLASPDARRDRFIARALDRHGDRYDYSQVVFVDQKTAVTIVCPTHGAFDQRPDNHTAKTATGCRSCAIDITRQARRRNDGQWKKRPVRKLRSAA